MTTPDSLPVGLFFGSFNPIHNGHLGIARRVLAQKYCREVWFVVSPCNPFKNEASLLPGKVRYSIVQAAIAGLPAMKACDVEFDMPHPSYTADTLRRLIERFPAERFSLIMGGDNLLGFPSWKDYAWIERNFPILVYPRPGSPLEIPPGMHVTIVDAPLFPLSATEIRERLARGEDLSGEVPAAALPLIRNAYAGHSRD